MRRARPFLALAALLLTGCGLSTSGPDSVISLGSWGGDHASLVIERTIASIEFDCAHGRFAAPVAVDRGQFDSRGVYIAEHGGPIRVGEVVIEQPARYSGTVDGDRMILRVTLDDGQDLGRYTLTRGTGGRVFKCL